MRRYAQLALRLANPAQAEVDAVRNPVDLAGADFAIYVVAWAYAGFGSVDLNEGDDTGSINSTIFSLGAKDNPTTIEGTTGTRPNAAGGELRVAFIDTTLRKRYIESVISGNDAARCAAFVLLTRQAEWDDADQSNADATLGAGTGEYARVN
jgi:hypothetical protein